MEEEGQSPLAYDEKRFDFYEIEWVIEKFCLASAKHNWNFESPEFTIRGFHTTKWLMILQRTSNAAGNFMKLILKRSDHDAGPDVMWVDWRIISLADCGHDSVRKLCCFKKGSHCSEELKSEEGVIDTLKPFEPDLLTVRCKLLFYSEDACKEFQPCGNEGVRSLSENLLRLFYTSQDYDLELRFGNDSIQAHKIVTCSRIRKLNYLLEQESRKTESDAPVKLDVLDLSFLKHYGMRKVLEYVYSGDLKHVLAEPSLDVSDCVWKLDISELKSYYTPNKLFFRTSVNSHEIKVKWLIPDIMKLMCHETETSPELIDEYFGTIWQLRISLKNEGNADYFAIRAEAIGDLEPMDLCLEFAISDKCDNYFFPKRMRCSTEDFKVFGFDKFLRGSVAKSFSDDNCLRVVARLRLSDGSSTSVTETHDISLETCTPAEQCYSSLSSDMESAYKSGFFSDFQLENNGDVYKFHKCIVAARCSEIYDRIRLMEEDDEYFPDIQSYIFNILLKYLYSGVLKDCECNDDYVELYKIIAHFDLPHLKNDCLKHFQAEVEYNLVLRAELLEISEQYQDEALKEAVMEYITEV